MIAERSSSDKMGNRAVRRIRDGRVWRPHSIGASTLWRAAVVTIRRRLGQPIIEDDPKLAAFLQGPRRAKGVPLLGVAALSCDPKPQEDDSSENQHGLKNKIHLGVRNVMEAKDPVDPDDIEAQDQADPRERAVEE